MFKYLSVRSIERNSPGLDSKEKISRAQEAVLRLEAIIKAATDGIIVIDELGVIEEINPAAARLFGYAPDELPGKKVELLMPQPHRSRHDQYMQNYYHTGEAKIIGVGREVYGLRKDGSQFPFRLSISEVRLGDRRIFTGIVHDLSEQKRIEHALREEKEKAQMYFDLANIINVVLDPEGCVVELNKKAIDFIGRPESEVVGQNWFRLILDKEEEKVVSQHFCAMMKGERPLTPFYENEIRLPSGKPASFVWHNNMIRDPRGKPIGLITSGIDITERREAERALEREKLRVQRYLDVANTIFVVIDREERINLLNRKGSEILGYPEEEVLGSNWFDLVLRPDRKKKVRQYFHKLMQEDVAVSDYFENTILTRQGEPRLIAWRNALIRDKEGKPQATISSGVDITEQRAAEDSVKKLNADLEARVEARTEELAEAINQLLTINRQLTHQIQERKAAETALRKSEQELRLAYEREKELSELKSRFVSMASHEFRTPLSTILSSADIIEEYRKSEQQPRRERHTHRIKSAVANLTGILNDFLSLSRLEEGSMQADSVEFDLEDFCHDVIDELQGLLKPGQTIDTHLPEQPVRIFLDKKFLKNVMFNLLSNAIKYSGTEQPIECAVRLADDTLHIRVTDYGIGIPEEEQQHLFSRFFRAHNVENIQGTGLGLNIVKRYLELMSGEISFTSVLGEGSTFEVRIPLPENENRA